MHKDRSRAAFPPAARSLAVLEWRSQLASDPRPSPAAATPSDSHAETGRTRPASAWVLLGVDGVLRLMFCPALLFSFRGVEFATNIRDVHMCRWQLQAHFVHRIGNDLRHRKIPEPLVVCWNNVPGRVPCACFCDRIFVSVRIFRP